jgi:thymidine phosphorylase
MSQPLGRAVGNAVEVAEAVRLLRGEERGRLRELAVAFAVEALASLEGRDPEDAAKAAEHALDSGAGAESFARMVEAQGGDPAVSDDPWSVLPTAPVRHDVSGPGGYLASTEAEELGRAAVFLGAGRLHKGDPIDPAVGFEFLPQIGDRLDPGEPVAVVHARDEESAERAGRMILGAIAFSDEPIEPPALIHGWHGSDRT